MSSSLGGMYELKFIFLKKNGSFGFRGKMSTRMWVKTAVVQVQGFAGRNIIMYLHTFIGFFNVISLEMEPYDGGTFILMKLTI